MRIIIKCAALFQAAEQLGVIAVRDPQLDSRASVSNCPLTATGRRMVLVSTLPCRISGGLSLRAFR